MKLSKLSKLTQIVPFKKHSVRNEFHSSLRSTDAFLVTYPKSGTTWMGFLIANIVNHSINMELHLKNFIDIVPDVNDMYFGAMPLEKYAHLDDPRVLMTHAPYDPLFPRVLYVLRDPRDVLVSYWHHKRLTDPSFRLSPKEFFLSDDHWPCNWDQHVKGWLLGDHSNVFSIRYEEMHKDIMGTLRKAVDFIGLRCEDQLIERAVLASKFDKMRKLEEKYGVDGARGVKDERFIRRGKVGSWSEELDDESVNIIERKYGRVMKQFGYEPVTLS